MMKTCGINVPKNTKAGAQGFTGCPATGFGRVETLHYMSGQADG